MLKDIAIITIHGMGKTSPDYYMSLERKLKRYIGTKIWEERVHLESVYYQKWLQCRQEDYWNDIDDEYNLKWDFLRKFMLFSFSDAGAIEHSLRGEQKLYKNIHHEIATAFDNSLVKLGDPSKPVIVIAQSLGGQQISNYIWDAGKGKRYFENQNDLSSEQLKFRKLKSCIALITTGCNIPIFNSGLEKPEVFERPNDNFVWNNYFDKDDVLGYPIKLMSESFNKDWITDSKVGVGGLIKGWNPACHTEYWTDKDVLKPIADIIKNNL